MMGRFILCAVSAWLALATWGCAADVQTVGRPDAPATTPKSADCEVPVHPIDYRVGPGCQEIGDVYVGDTGFTVDCEWQRVKRIIRAQACLAGADAAQIVAHHQPSFWSSSCDQVRARFLVCALPPAQE